MGQIRSASKWYDTIRHDTSMRDVGGGGFVLRSRSRDADRRVVNGGEKLLLGFDMWMDKGSDLFVHRARARTLGERRGGSRGGAGGGRHGVQGVVFLVKGSTMCGMAA